MSDNSSTLVSLIVPVRNKQSTLCKCLRSAARQTWTNIEVIIIDDESSDLSARLAREFCDRDSRFRLIINQRNIGLYASRYAGVAEARGEWLMFLDADDWLQPRAVEELLISVQSLDVDMAQMRFQRRFGSVRHRDDNDLNTPLFNRHVEGDEYRSLTSYIGMRSLIQPSCWTKIYRTALLRQVRPIRFDRFWGEDQIFNIQYLRLARSMTFVPYVGYNYRWGGETVANYHFSALDDYKYVYKLKRILGQDVDSINAELQLLLRYYLRQLMSECGWTPEALVDVLADELRDPLWHNIGMTDNAATLVEAEAVSIQRHPLKYIAKRFMR